MKNKNNQKTIHNFNSIIKIFILFLLIIELGTYWFFLQDKKISLKIQTRVMNAITANFNNRYQQGINYIQEDKYPQAYQTFRNLDWTIPCQHKRCFFSGIKRDTLDKMAFVLEKQNKKIKAYEIYEKLNSFDEQNCAYYYHQARLQKDFGNLEKALELIETSLSYYPDFLPAVNMKLDILLLSEKNQDFIQFFEKFQSKSKFIHETQMGYISIGNNETSKNHEIKNIIVDNQIHKYDVKIHHNDQNELLYFSITPILQQNLFSLKKIILYQDEKELLVLENFDHWETQNLTKIENDFLPTNNPFKLEHPSPPIELSQTNIIGIFLKVAPYNYQLSQHEKTYDKLVHQ
jgi:tetratricopeptide (TPR) repeat protein